MWFSCVIKIKVFRFSEKPKKERKTFSNFEIRKKIVNEGYK